MKFALKPLFRSVLLGWFHYGFDPMGIHHHSSPPFGTIFLKFSKHQTSKSEIATEILGGGQVLHWKFYANRPWLWLADPGDPCWNSLCCGKPPTRGSGLHFFHFFPYILYVYIHIYTCIIGLVSVVNLPTKNTCSMLQSQSHSFFSPKIFLGVCYVKN